MFDILIEKHILIKRGMPNVAIILLLLEFFRNKGSFEKKQQKTNTNIQMLQRKIDKYQKMLKVSLLNSEFLLFSCLCSFQGPVQVNYELELAEIKFRYWIFFLGIWIITEYRRRTLHIEGAAVFLPE